MLKIGIFRSRSLVIGLMAAFVLVIIPVRDFAQAPPMGGVLTGHVVGADMKTPVVNAMVKIRNFNTLKEYTSPTDNTGMFRIRDFAQEPLKGGTLGGQLFSADMKTPVVNATVKIRNLNTQKEFSSLTDKMGMFSITGIDEGWYTLGVSSGVGDYNLNYGIYIKAGEKAKLNLSMKGAGVLEGRGIGSSSSKGFFATPVGILVIVAVAGGVGFGVYELTKKKEEVSPIR